MKVTVLGCGGSGGVPLIGGLWGDCDPAEPRNRRTRPSILIESGGARLLIDTTPDLRGQLLDNDIGMVDAVLYTHSHADHCHGIDDLRILFKRRGRVPLPIHAARFTLAPLARQFAYAMPQSGARSDYYAPFLDPREITPGRPFTAAGLAIRPLEQAHGGTRPLGFRIGDFAYCTDVRHFPPESWAALAGVRWLILGAAMPGADHPTHATLPIALSWIAELGCEAAWLTHLTEWMDYRTVMAACPHHVRPAHDGLIIDLPEPEGANLAESESGESGSGAAPPAAAPAGGEKSPPG